MDMTKSLSGFTIHQLMDGYCVLRTFTGDDPAYVKRAKESRQKIIDELHNRSKEELVAYIISEVYDGP